MTEIIQKPSFNITVATNDPKYIIIYHDYSTRKGDEIATTINPIDSGFSYHYIVDNDFVYQTIESLDNSANHLYHDNLQGTLSSEVNRNNTIAILMCMGGSTMDVINNTVDLIKQLNIHPDNVLREYDVNGRNSPAAWRSYNWKEWRHFKNMLGTDSIDEIDENVITILPSDVAELPKNFITHLQVSDLKYFTPNCKLPLFSRPVNVDNYIIDIFTAGETIRFDKTFDTPTLSWVSYISYDGKRRYLPTYDKINSVSYGDLSNDDIELTNMEVPPTSTNHSKIFITAKGTFISSRYMRVRSEPKLASDYLFIIHPSQSFDYDGMIRTDDLVWLKLVQNGTVVEMYVPIQTINPYTKEISPLIGNRIEQTNPNL